MEEEKGLRETAETGGKKPIKLTSITKIAIKEDILPAPPQKKGGGGKGKTKKSEKELNLPGAQKRPFSFLPSLPRVLSPFPHLPFKAYTQEEEEEGGQQWYLGKKKQKKNKREKGEKNIF